jgi:hypothetical protein
MVIFNSYVKLPEGIWLVMVAVVADLMISMESWLHISRLKNVTYVY